MDTQLLTYPAVVDHEIQRRLRTIDEERRRRLARSTPSIQRWTARRRGPRATS